MTMLVSNIGRLRRLATVAGVGALAVAIAACAASTNMKSGGESASSIADVQVERAGAATTVTLVGVEDPVFTAFSQQAPERVVVDLAATRADDVGDSLSVHDGLVKEVVLSPYATASGETMTRVEVTLAMPADYQVIPSPEGLVIRVEPLPGMLGADPQDRDAMDTDEPDPWAIVPASNDDSEPLPLAMADPASKLMGVDARAVGEGALVHLQADGVVSTAESFTLENPNRLVVDLPGLTSEVSQTSVDVGAAQAARVRVGQHADMVRVVIDAGDAADPFQGRRVIPAATGLVVVLGSGDALDWAVQEAVGSAPMLASDPVPATEDVATTDASASDSDWMTVPAEGTEMAEVAPTPESMVEETASTTDTANESEGPITIYGVEYDAQETRDRVVILGDRPVDYLLFEPSPDTVVLTIQNAVIDPEAAVRIAPDPGGPISLVTAFAQPETQGSEVRVVVKRADGLKPEISRRGSLVIVDFPRDGSIAATPPAMVTPDADTPATQVAKVTPTPVDPAQPPAAPAPVPGTPATPVAAPAAQADTLAIDVLQDGGLMDSKSYAGRRISLDFKDIDMADILRLIAEVSDLNVIAGEEVSGRVTIRLVDVPWDQALDVILLTKGLGFIRIGNVLRIAPQAVLAQEEEMRLQEKRNLELLEDLVVKLQPVNYASSGDMKGMVSRLLSQRGTVDVDKRTNTLIIKDIPSVIDEATALVKAIDTQTPQVLIEAKVVEANLDFSREFGVSWGVGAQGLNDAFDSGSGARTDLGSDAFRLNTTGGNPVVPGTTQNNAQFLNPLTANPTALFSVAGFILDEKLNLDLQLQAAEVNGDGKVISSPRVVTLDNNQASIEQGVSIPFQTFENGDAQLEFVDAVLKLDVTPHITADRSIIMKIKVSRNAPDDSVFTLTGSPAISKNQVDTETLVKDGQTLVLGGIYVIDKAERQSRVPYLHSLPLLGTLFRNNEISDSRKELLIFVTPRIVAIGEVAS
jgi:type IV pilus assembly protein PilQ